MPQAELEVSVELALANAKKLQRDARVLVRDLARISDIVDADLDGTIGDNNQSAQPEEAQRNDNSSKE